MTIRGKSVRAAVCLTVMIFLTWPTPAQSISPEAASGTTIHVRSSLVLVPTLVHSTLGKPVTNLGGSDFRLTDNGVTQNILVEETGPASLAVVVLMQTGGRAYLQFRNYRQLQAMLENMMGTSSHRVALVTFDSRAEQIWNFPSLLDGLAYAFTHPVRGDQGVAILDAVNFCIDLFDHQPSNLHRVIVLLSQGKDDGSNTSPEELVKHLGRSNVAIYSITFSSQKTRRKVKAGVPTKGKATLEIASEAVRDNTATEVAALSGGEEMTFANSGDLDGTLSTLVSDLTTGYTLSFHPKSDQPGLHVIQVEMKKKDMFTVAARPNYWVSGTGN